MYTIYYNKDGWVCDRFPYDLPIDNEERKIEVDEETYLLTLSVDQYKAWRVVKGKLVVQEYETQPRKELLELEREEILQWLRDNDYLVNKVFLGEWEANDPRFINYKELRSQKRLRLDSIESELGV